MATLAAAMNTDELPDGRSFDLVPAGWVVAHIVDSESAPNSKGTGERLNLTWEVIEGEHERAKFWQGINYLHESPKAQAIGQGEIKSICAAVGFAGLLENSDVLHGIPCRVKLGIEAGTAKPGGGMYDDKNVVKDVKPTSAPVPAGKPENKPAQKPGTLASGNLPAKPAPGKPAAGPPAAGNRPWNRGPARSVVDDEIPL